LLIDLLHFRFPREILSKRDGGASIGLLDDHGFPVPRRDISCSSRLDQCREICFSVSYLKRDRDLGRKAETICFHRLRVFSITLDVRSISISSGYGLLRPWYLAYVESIFINQLAERLPSVVDKLSDAVIQGDRPNNCEVA
jgi:hypothetical protein